MHGSMLTRSGMGRATQGLLTGRQDYRPDPLYMARLIMRGLTEDKLQEVWYKAGNQMPRMQATLTEANTLIPFIERASDKLAEKHSSELKLFAARDGECLYDYYAVAHADDSKRSLLPASSELWDSEGWKDKSLARSFLRRYGLTRSVVVNTDQLVSVIDSGFYGRVGKRLEEKVQKLYNGYSLIDAHRLNVRLMHAEPDAFGIELIDIKSQDIKRERKTLPRASKDVENFYYHCKEPGFLIGRAIEMMPRYHGAYTGIARKKGRVVAIVGEERVSQNVDNPKQVTDSIVNRLAAAMVQYRIVRAALERTPYGDALPKSSGEPRPISKGLRRYLQTHFAPFLTQDL